VHADEEIGLRFVGDGGAGFERDKGVVRACVDNLSAKAVVQELAEAECHVKDDILFSDAADAEGAGIVAAVAGVDNDAVDLEAERADE
jgi:hypothetical protein